MNKPVYFGKAMLDLSKTFMYESHYDYMQHKYRSKTKLCYIDTDNFVFKIETEEFYKDIAKDAEKRFDTRGYSKDDNWPLPIGKNQKVADIVKDELCGKIMTKFVVSKANICV